MLYDSDDPIDDCTVNGELTGWTNISSHRSKEKKNERSIDASSQFEEYAIQHWGISQQ